MDDGLLPVVEADALRAAEPTYAEVGQTRTELPEGYRHLRRRADLGSGPARFEDAARTLLHWGMHRRAGVRVRPSSGSVQQDSVAVLRVGPAVLAVKAPVRVVYVVDEPRRRGFAYGTLPGHPESGEEAFVVTLDDSGAVRLEITAFSRAATLLTRAAGPAGRAAQRLITQRYLSALQERPDRDRR
ncbi:DUF1990 family protein [Nocardioides mesophilus]|uniref:DUF1990 domain-containing protein n=1 Tax=Nocardioides mesophilus TaxID=433659 RepID=A0A7G9R755_9ACTN|nr:DUF1990 domain-containing protein [Nocardioides mesophilus]QNN51430.1 DUF1990 domain-containing protein [Nocardioides mesophilus]